MDGFQGCLGFGGFESLASFWISLHKARGLRSSGFRVQGLGFRGLGFRGLGFRV